MRRLLLRIVSFPIAVFLLFEAWAWERISPLIAYLVRLVAFPELRKWLLREIERLSPRATLVLYLIPAVILLAVKIVGLYFLGKGAWFLAVLILLFANLFGMGVTAVLFQVTKPKLLQIPWFRVWYERILLWIERAHRLVDPATREIKRLMQGMREFLFGEE